MNSYSEKGGSAQRIRIMKQQFREVRLIDLITYSILPLPVTAVIWLAAAFLPGAFLPADFPFWVFYLIAGILTYFTVKRFAIGVVLLYKVFAPMSVRKRCLFTPTCSTYMIMAIGKYGLFVGVYKGIRRILRCHPPNGGEDYP